MGRPQQQQQQRLNLCFPTASTWPPSLKHTHTQPPPPTSSTPITTPMLERLKPVAKQGPHPDTVSLLDPSQETQGWQTKKERRIEKERKDREMGWITVLSGTNCRQSQHNCPNGSSIQRLPVYSLQEKSMNWNIPSAHRRHWQEQQHNRRRQQEQRIMSNISMYQWS